jgi:cation transport ATPase
MSNLDLKLQGMSCASCTHSIEKAILNAQGVVTCSIIFSQYCCAGGAKSNNSNKMTGIGF